MTNFHPRCNVAILFVLYRGFLLMRWMASRFGKFYYTTFKLACKSKNCARFMKPLSICHFIVYLPLYEPYAALHPFIVVMARIPHVKLLMV